MLYLSQKEITRLEFLKIFGVSGLSLLAPGLLLNELPEKVYGQALKAENSSSVKETIIPVKVTIKPDVIKLGSGEKFSSTVVFPESYDIADVTVSSVRCEDAPVVDNILRPKDRSIIFLYNSGDLRDDLPGGYSVEFTVSGQLKDGASFEGSDTIAVIGASKGVIYHTSTRKRKSCNACKSHAVNKIFVSREAADTLRAHRGCNCGIVKEEINWQYYISAFGQTSRGGTTVYDKRRGWPPRLPVGVNE
ncbi:hypothetical protein FJZ31_41320 [Candidatus Poribacteria bacterium]|nr:hypothetical protein [Candidatus Poribacteria bacterium]